MRVYIWQFPLVISYNFHGFTARDAVPRDRPTLPWPIIPCHVKPPSRVLPSPNPGLCGFYVAELA